MTNVAYGIYGASGFGREVLPLARAFLPQGAAQLVLIDDSPANAATINGCAVVPYQAFRDLSADIKHVAIAIGNSEVRQKLAERLDTDGIRPWTVRAANSLILDAVTLGDGAIVCPFVTVTSNIRIGRHFHANIYSYVAHDCVIGDFVTFAPGVKCNGNVVIEDHAYIGTGAILRQGTAEKPLRIGRGAVVGMGAVVTKDVPAGMTVVGNPARPLVKRRD